MPVLRPEDVRLIEAAKRSFLEDYQYLLRVVEAAQTRRPTNRILRAVK